MNEFERLSDGVRGELGAQRTAQEGRGAESCQGLAPAAGKAQGGGHQGGERGKQSVCVRAMSACGVLSAGEKLKLTL